MTGLAIDKKWIIGLVIGFAVLVVLLILLFRKGSDDDKPSDNKGDNKGDLDKKRVDPSPLPSPSPSPSPTPSPVDKDPVKPVKKHGCGQDCSDEKAVEKCYTDILNLHKCEFGSPDNSDNFFHNCESSANSYDLMCNTAMQNACKNVLTNSTRCVCDPGPNGKCHPA